MADPRPHPGPYADPAPTPTPGKLQLASCRWWPEYVGALDPDTCSRTLTLAFAFAVRQVPERAQPA